MAEITGYTAARMKSIEDNAIVSGVVTAGRLILSRYNATTLDAGAVVGPVGPSGSLTVVTSSTRPTGGARFVGLGIFESDTKRFYIWDGTNWIYKNGLWICTSSTRPSAPFEGLEIYETDTDRRLIYNGVRFDQPWNTPWGLISGPATITANSTAVGGTSTAITLTFTATANRLYKITGFARNTSQTGVGTTDVQVARSTTVLASTLSSSVAGPGAVGTIVALDSPPVGSVTYNVRTSTSATTAQIIAGAATPAFLFVEDIGPNGVPV